MISKRKQRRHSYEVVFSYELPGLGSQKESIFCGARSPEEAERKVRERLTAFYGSAIELVIKEVKKL